MDQGIVTDLRLLVGFYQLLGQMDNVLSIEFPDPVPQFMKMISVVFFDVRKFINLDCWDIGGFFGKLTTNVFVSTQQLATTTASLAFCCSAARSVNVSSLRTGHPGDILRRMCPDVHERAPNHKHCDRGRGRGCERIEHGDDLASAEPVFLHLPALCVPHPS